mgnify:CR=1 FL=1
MAGRGSSKWHTERARREKVAAKRAKRDERAALPPDESAAPQGAPADQADVLAALAALHEQYEHGSMSLDDFDEAKQQLVEQLRVD